MACQHTSVRIIGLKACSLWPCLACQMAKDVADSAIQVLGGYGYMADYQVRVGAALANAQTDSQAARQTDRQ